MVRNPEGITSEYIEVHIGGQWYKFYPDTNEIVCVRGNGSNVASALRKARARLREIEKTKARQKNDKKIGDPRRRFDRSTPESSRDIVRKRRVNLTDGGLELARTVSDEAREKNERRNRDRRQRRQSNAQNDGKPFRPNE